MRRITIDSSVICTSVRQALDGALEVELSPPNDANSVVRVALTDVDPREIHIGREFNVRLEPVAGALEGLQEITEAPKPFGKDDF